MRYLKAKNPRKGAVLVENAIVLLILIMFIIGILVGGLGVFRYQQIAMLAREGARYACVRGTQYQADGKGTAATKADVYNNAILPMAVGLGGFSISNVEVVWKTGGVASDTPVGPVYANPSSDPPGQPVGTTVEVTVSYTWLPEAFFGDGATLTSKSVMPMQY